MTLTPAYSRDYKSKKEVLEAFLGNRDFVLQPDERLINRPQVEKDGVTQVNVRYKSLTRVAVLEKEKDSWKAK